MHMHTPASAAYTIMFLGDVKLFIGSGPFVTGPNCVS